MEISHFAPVRVCCFGVTPPAAEWLRELSGGVAAGVPVERLLHAHTAAAAVHAAASKFPGEDFILLRAGTLLPPFWYTRLIRALALPDVLVASPLDNTDPARAPLPPGVESNADAHAIDAMCYIHGHHAVLDWSTFSPLLSAWNGAALRGLDLEKIRHCELPELLTAQRGILLDHLYVADPAQSLCGPPLPVRGSDPIPPSALGELRERVAAALPQAAQIRNGYPGLDAKPVVLHVLHGWGGGAERFVRDLAAVDTARHHLVLTARGNFDRRRYGEVLELLDAGMTQPPLRRLYLSDPIASTAFTHRGYAAFLAEIIRDYGIDGVVVSSLIGHSLDAYRSGLPTVHFVHDFYPLWPLLHRNLDDAALKFDAAQLTADLAGADNGFEFAERDPAYWLALREALADAALQAKAHLIAPSRAALDIFLRLQPRLSILPQDVIAHGMQMWPDASPLPAPPHRDKLRLIVLGRVRRGKAANLLRVALPGLREHAELFLLGAGPESREFFGQRDVHILLNYRRDELPGLLARIAPDAALILPDFAETFSYTLSELSSFGIPVIATRLGALAERIHDGVDGFLVAPNAASIVAGLAHLRADRSSLERARAALTQVAPRTLDDMAADYRNLLPAATHPSARYVAHEIQPAQLTAQTRAARIGAARREISARNEQIAAQQRELAKRSDWAFDLDAQIQRARSALDQVHAELDARTAWAQAEINAHRVQARAAQERQQAAQEREQVVRAELQRLELVHTQLQIEFEERTRWAKSLDAQLVAMGASTSWRITKPLRFFMRKLRAVRTRLRFDVNRLHAIMHRTRGSLASRGVSATVKRAADEFRRSPSLPVKPALVVPSENVVPFTVPRSAHPRVSIVIPVFNKIHYTIACLRSLVEHAGNTAFEVIVVDDASSDATPQRLAQIEGIQVLRNAQNLGFVGSCNAGAQRAQGEFVLFLNNDTVVTAGWLEALLRCFDEEPACGLAGAKLVYPDGRLQEAGGIVFADGSGWNYGRFEDPADPRYNFRREVDYCSGAAIVLRRELFAQLGQFDTRYAPAYYEDTDLAFAVRAAGKQVFYEPRSTVVHFEGVSAGTDSGSGMKRFQNINHDKFLQKWKSELARQAAPVHTAKLARSAANWRARGRVLIVDACTPRPDHDSGSLRMVNLMRLLHEMGYAVSFLPENRAHDGRYTQDLQELGIEALYHPFVGDPIAWLRERGRELNAVVLSRHYVAANYVGLVRLYAPQATLIFDTVDLHYLREQRAAEVTGSVEQAQQAARTRTQELKLMRECDVNLVVSDVEQELLAREAPGARVEIFSNVHEVYGRRREFEARRDLVFIGGFQHPPNVDAVLWFVRDVFPRVRAVLPEVDFHVIGSKAPPAIMQLAHDGVVVHGFVADIAPFMDDCRVSVAPLRYGAGVKGKVNMAMSYGLPVVATSAAVEGMHVHTQLDGDDPDVLVADSPDDFAAAIVRIYNDATLWKTLSDNGLNNVREHFSFDVARTALRRILPD